MDMAKSAKDEIVLEALPWIYFKVKDQTYAISSEAIASIVMAPASIETLPQANEAIMGIFVLRGEIVPLLSIRKLFGVRTLASELDEMADMLDARKKDHLNWVAKFDECVSQKLPFPLAEDPHQCAFGKWYDSFSTKNRLVTFHLSQLEEPHHDLHRLARIYNNLHMKPTDKAPIKLATRAKEEFLPMIVKKMDDTIAIYRNGIRGMVIVLEVFDRLLGIMVDSVLTVKEIGSSLSEMGDDGKELLSHYAEDVWQDPKLGTVVKLNYEKLLECLGI